MSNFLITFFSTTLRIILSKMWEIRPQVDLKTNLNQFTEYRFIISISRWEIEHVNNLIDTARLLDKIR